MSSERVCFKQIDVVNQYLADPTWARFDQKKEAHIKRRYEYFSGRVCAALAYQKLTGKKLLELNAREDRSPIWPQQIIGSISHNETYVVCEVSDSGYGLGIDLIKLGAVKKHLKKSICTQDDIDHATGVFDEHILSYIFSIKESLYKAVYPLINEFFGFQDASVLHIDLTVKKFTVRLEKDTTALFMQRHTDLIEKIKNNCLESVTFKESCLFFEGHFAFIDPEHILTHIQF